MKVNEESSGMTGKDSLFSKDLDLFDDMLSICWLLNLTFSLNSLTTALEITAGLDICLTQRS